MFYETGPREKDKYLYPPAVQALGWFFELSPTVLTLVYPAWVLYRWVMTSGEEEVDILHLYGVQCG